MYSRLAKSRLVFWIGAPFLVPHGVRAEALDDQYRGAVTDAAIVEQAEIMNNLNSASRENPTLIWNEDGAKLLVVTWKAKGAYQNFIKPYTATSDKEDYVVWVTLAPQVKNFCRDLTASGMVSKEDLDLRLKQFLGLHHSWNYDVFVELWVSSEDLFRPCVDPEATDTACNMNFGNATPTVKNVAD